MWPIDWHQYSIAMTLSVLTNWKPYVACNFDCSSETEWLFKVTVSHVHCKSGDIISETV